LTVSYHSFTFIKKKSIINSLSITIGPLVKIANFVHISKNTKISYWDIDNFDIYLKKLSVINDFIIINLISFSQ